MIKIKEINADIIELKKSPLYAMSLASMELFHSNFWRWLMEYDPKYIKVFFDIEIDKDKKLEIKREYKNTDITIEYDKEIYIIENKFKSLPNVTQLKEYENKFKDEKTNRSTFKKGIYTFPINENFLKDEQIYNWEFKSYKAIVDTIDEIRNGNESTIEAQIIKEYVSMTNQIINLITKVKDFYGEEWIAYVKKENKQLLNLLTEARICDIIKKINCCIISKKIQAEVEKEFSEELSKEEIIIQTTFSNTYPCLSVRWKRYYDINDKEKGYFLIGPQLQNDALRSMIHICTKELKISNIKTEKRETIDLIYNNIKDEIFPDKYYLSNREKVYNEFKGIHDNKEYIAIYHYVKIDDFSFNNICKQILELLRKYKDVDTDALLRKLKDIK